ncbi:MAG: hypothetical protein GY861_27710 [bacterium]|nr:hypothetical protein [bacterium]
MNKIQQIYDYLMKEYGHQGWWPVTPLCCRGGKTLPIYGVAIKSDKQKFEIIIGAILTQNTAWKNVEKAIIELNKKDLIDINKILKIKHNELAETIKSSGYYNQKAKSLKSVAEFLKKTPIAKLEKMELSKARHALLDVKGIGNETADSILLYALNKPIFVVDAYTKRIVTELKLVKKDATYHEIQELFMSNLQADPKIFNEYHALLVEHAKRFYSRKPYGVNCPLEN